MEAKPYSTPTRKIVTAYTLFKEELQNINSEEYARNAWRALPEEKKREYTKKWSDMVKAGVLVHPIVNQFTKKKVAAIYREYKDNTQKPMGPKLFKALAAIGVTF